MSEQDIQRIEENNASVAQEQQAEDIIEVVIDKATNELTFRDPSTGRAAKIKATVVEEQEQPQDILRREPLTPEQFRDGLQRLQALGVTWTADAPHFKAKDKESENAFFTEEYRNIRNEYPRLPSELAAVVLFTLTGSSVPEALVGNKDYLERKSAIVSELIIDADFSSAFFFKNAIKVPYFSKIDWEVVFKLFEKSVHRPITVPYALLSLELEYPDSDEDETITVAANLDFVNELIDTLMQIRTALEKSRSITASVFNEVSKLEWNSNDTSTEKERKQLG